MRRALALALLPLVLPCCASAASEDRRAYILAHSHGWIELTIADRSIPLVPIDNEPKDSVVDSWRMPTDCHVEVHVSGEPFLWDHAYPTGDEPPFRADTGFRFPAAAGPARVHLEYGGCRVTEVGEVVPVVLDAEIVVQEGLTHEIEFDGQTLHIHQPRPSSVVTLEDVYEALTGRRSPAK